MDCFMTKIAVVGAGLIGRAWALSFARAGYDVALSDAVPAQIDAALTFIDGALEELAGFDLLNGARPAAVRQRIRGVPGLAEALAGATHVQENTPEKLETKRVVYAELDRLAPADAVIASSTSALLPSSFTEGLAGRARCLVAHPINPPYLIPAVEIVPAPWTDPATVERTRQIMAGAGHASVVLRQEIDGFIVNRLQGALLQEAFRLVADGQASVEDVDVAIREGLALRWSFMGPFETIDLNAPGGVRDYVTRYHGIYDGLFEQQTRRADWVGPVIDTIEGERQARLDRKDLAKRAAWRDRRLMALAAHKRAAEKEIGG
jgi:3-hydroxyacyl-CoA dehydrogenase